MREPDLKQIVLQKPAARGSVIAQHAARYRFDAFEPVERRMIGENGIFGKREPAFRQTTGSRQHDGPADKRNGRRIAGRFDLPDSQVETEFDDVAAAARRENLPVSQILKAIDR